MSTMTIDLNLSHDQLSQLDEVARSRQLVVSEAIQLAVTEWLDQHGLYLLCCDAFSSFD